MSHSNVSDILLRNTVTKTRCLCRTPAITAFPRCLSHIVWELVFYTTEHCMLYPTIHYPSQLYNNTHGSHFTGFLHIGKSDPWKPVYLLFIWENQNISPFWAMLTIFCFLTTVFITYIVMPQFIKSIAWKLTAS